MTNRGGAEEEDETENNRMEGRTNGDKFVRLSSENAAPRRQTDGAFFVSGGSTDLPHRTLLPAPRHTLGHWISLQRFCAEIRGIASWCAS